MAGLYFYYYFTGFVAIKITLYNKAARRASEAALCARDQREGAELRPAGALDRKCLETARRPGGSGRSGGRLR
ncbi:Hypothetical predicted protein [Podarcis lilfordi]|uniref:Uncharacterized protein n=1 Tax=Podarcis lilfordi TaxID=74358 RepID=A0AA35PMY6_9SAUR|nr:Hypothetical predicted protein [Podarcis lilfordi]